MWYVLVYAVYKLGERCGGPPTAQEVAGLLKLALCPVGDVEGELQKLADLGYVEARGGRYVATGKGIGAVEALAAVSNCIRAHMECIDGAVEQLCKPGR
mgnify:CR=1 FL=1